MNYDITMKCHRKDYYKLQLVLDRIKLLNPQPQNLYIVSPNDNIDIETNYKFKVINILDKDVYPKIDKKKIAYRPNWVWTNLVSITQDFTENDLYLDIQSDVFFLKKINLFSSDMKPKLFRTKSNINNNYNEDSAYFNFSKKMFNISKLTTGTSYIIDYTMYDKNILKELIKDYTSVEKMINESYKIISNDCFPADGEIYGNFVEKVYPNVYNITDEINHVFSGTNGYNENTNDVIQYIQQCQSHSLLNSCAYHNWI